VTNAIFPSLHRLGGRPVSPTTTPVPLHKNRARHKRQFKWPHQRRASVHGSAAALRSGFVPAVSPPALHFFRRRPPTEAIQERFDHALTLSKLTQHIE